MSDARPEHRSLRFDSIAQLLDELRLLEEAEARGTLRSTGQWTPGQIYGHIAGWIGYSLDGYPAEMRVPWFVKAVFRLMKRRLLRGPLRAGVRIPHVPGGTYCTEPMGSVEGLRRLRAALDRLQYQAPRLPNPVLGPMTHAEWILSHLRHAELHIGFLHHE